MTPATGATPATIPPKPASLATTAMVAAMLAFAAVPAPADGQPTDDASLDGIHNYLQISDRLSTSGQIEMEEIAAIRDAGFEVLVNLAPARAEQNMEEGFRVVNAGLAYIQIPVDWRQPSLRDLRLFFDVMDANRDRRVYVHCFANMRVSVFVYLYRTLREGADHEAAWADLLEIWDPNENEETSQWPHFIETARRELGG